jgi:hypothetical protein
MMPSGGRRPGAGRPRGSTQPGNCRAEIRKEIMKSPATILRTSDDGVFAGDAVAFLVSIYRDESLPLGLRQSAAMAASPFERPRMSDQRILLLEKREKEVSDAEPQRQIDEGDRRLDALEAAWDRLTNENEAELVHLVESGDITPRGAAWVRSMWRQPERLALPPPSEPAMPDRAEPPPEPRQGPPAREVPPEYTPPAEIPNGAAPRAPKASPAIFGYRQGVRAVRHDGRA